MRTVIFSFPYASAPGGGERYLERVVEGLLKRGRTFALVSSSKALLSLFAARGWKSVPFWPGVEPVSKSSVLIFPLFALVSFPIFAIMLFALSRRGADSVICLSLTDKLLATPLARLFGLKVVWLEHLIPGRAITLNPYRPILVRLARLATIVTVSLAVEDRMVRIGFPKKHFVIIPPGLAPDECSGQQSAVKVQGSVIGAVSRLAREKNLGLLIEAFAAAHERVPKARLVIRGDGPEAEMLRHLAGKLGLADKIRFEGFVADRARLYDGLHVLAVPSAQESFGLSALEAMGRGVSVVATRVGGLPEVVIDGQTGLLVPPDDALAFSDALVKMITDDAFRSACAEAGRRRAAETFPLERTIDAWHRLLS